MSGEKDPPSGHESETVLDPELDRAFLEFMRSREELRRWFTQDASAPESTQ